MCESTPVEIELSDAEYRRFKSLAREQGLSLTAALREAVEIWMEHQETVDPDDPLFDILQQLDQENAPETRRTNAATEDDLIEEWSGETTGIQFLGGSDSEE